MKPATNLDLRRLKVELERQERPAELAALNCKIEAAIGSIGESNSITKMMENRILGAAVNGKENPVKRVFV